MTTPLLPPVRHGDLFLARDEDYLFGQGAVWLRVVAVHEVRWVRGKPWVFLRGRTVWARGIAKRQCDVLVKGEALRTRRRRAA
jgi:hypothetical protein